MSTFEIGQKVVTPLGFVGEIVQSGDEMSKVAVRSVDGNYIYSYKFMNEKLKLYRTPHEKLLDMGFKEVRRDDDNIVLKKYSESELHTFIIFHIKLKSFIVCDLFSVAKLVDLELSRILTEYLEWLEEQK